MELYPYTFKAVYKNKIWGGRNLERIMGRMLPEGDIGESWELADLTEGVSVVNNGPLKGKTLTELVDSMGSDLLGEAEAINGRFPLLVKILDANDILSLQVHPDRSAVERIGPTAALKTECWYVIESRNGFIYKGLKEGVTREDFRRAVESDTVADCVVRYDVQTGDFHWLPAGTVHALGNGVIVGEVQTPSDTTYRVSDWGRGREIHVDMAMDCIHFGTEDLSPPGVGDDVLVSCEFFSISKVVGELPRVKPVGKCVSVMLLPGPGPLVIKYGGNEMKIWPGQTVLIPAGISANIDPAGRCSYLLTTIGKGEPV